MDKNTKQKKFDTLCFLVYYALRFSRHVSDRLFFTSLIQTIVLNLTTGMHCLVNWRK